MKLIKGYPLASFFVLAHAITWILQLSAIFLAPAQGMALSNETNFQYFLDLLGGRLNSAQAMVYILFTLGAGPLFAALIVTRVVEGAEGLKDLWRRSTLWKVEAKWYLAAFDGDFPDSKIRQGESLASSPTFEWVTLFPSQLPAPASSVRK